VQLAIVLAVVLVFILALVGGLKLIDRDHRPAEEQLKERFARGEISEAQYLRSLAILQHGTDFVLEAERAPLLGEPGAGDT
jgi:uncharacterized membrane protein